MDILISLLVARLATGEELRFSAVHEQPAAHACGVAVVSSLLSLYCGRDLDDAGRSLLEPRPVPRAITRAARGGPGTSPVLARLPSLADLGEALATSGVASAAFLMDLDGLSACLAAGYAPLVAHFSRPRAHFALVLGMEGDRVVVADPARGVEALGRAVFAARWSGAVLLVDRGALDPEGRGLRDAALQGALARAELARRGAAARDALRAALGTAGGTVRSTGAVR